MLIAAKFFDDAYYNNAFYAKVGGILVSEMNSLEVEFLFRVNYSLHVHTDVFYKYQAELVIHALCAGLQKPGQSLSLRQLATPNNCSELTTRHILFSEATVSKEAISRCGNFVPAHHTQHITPSPPESEFLPDIRLVHGGLLPGVSVVNQSRQVLSSYSIPAPNMAHVDNDLSIALIGPDCPFSTPQGHNAMPVTSDSAVAHIPPTDSTFLNESSHKDDIQRSHLITPVGAVAALAYSNSSGVQLSGSEFSEALNVVYPRNTNYIPQYQHRKCAQMQNDIIYHYNHEPLAHQNVAQVVKKKVQVQQNPF